MMSRRLVYMFAVLPVAVLCLSGTSLGADGQMAATIGKIKAAFVLNFIKFTTWPEGAFEDGASPLVIGVVGECDFGAVLGRVMEGQVVRGRPISVRFYPVGGEEGGADGSEGSSGVGLAEEVRSCHVVFVSESEESRVEDILQELEGTAALTVSDIRGFAGRGGMLGLVLRKNHIVFEANRDRIGRSPITISSKLMRLAEKVRHGRGRRQR